MTETLVEALTKRAMSALRTQLNGQTMPGLHPPGSWSATGDAGSIDIGAIVRGCLSELDRLGYAVVPKGPTEEMLRKGADTEIACDGASPYGDPIGKRAAVECWSAMLTAAPRLSR